MNKSELVVQVAKDTNMSKSAAEKALNSIISNVKKTLKKGQSVSLVGFGTWSVAKRTGQKRKESSNWFSHQNSS